MLRPTEFTDAYEDDTPTSPPLIFLAGPIKHWWACWESPEHRLYVEHRATVRRLLIQRGYLTYAPWEAFKGTWNPAAQGINYAAIEASNLLIDMTPMGIPADGTAAERLHAEACGVKRMGWPPNWSQTVMLQYIHATVGPGQAYAGN